MKRTALFVAALLVVGGCTDQGPGSVSELERNRSLWLASRPLAYEYAVERVCFCGGEARGPVRVAVLAEAVTSRVYVDSGEPVDAMYVELFPTVDGLFDVLQEAIDGGASEVRVTYDPTTGVPLDFWIDYSETVIDEEVGYTVVESVTATNGG